MAARISDTREEEKVEQQNAASREVVNEAAASGTPPGRLPSSLEPYRVQGQGKPVVRREREKLTPEQRAERRAKRALRRQQRLAYDTDGDGQLNKDERRQRRIDKLHEFQQKELELFDDGDGVLSDEELAVRDAARIEKAERKAQDLVELADTDGDGVVSEMELNHDDRKTRKLSRKFDRFDADGDGKVTQDEIVERSMRKYRRKDRRLRRIETKRAQ